MELQARWDERTEYPKKEEARPTIQCESGMGPNSNERGANLAKGTRVKLADSATSYSSLQNAKACRRGEQYKSK